MADILTLPTETEVERAWSRYQRLADAWATDPDLRSDLDHCQKTARAWSVWRDLFLASERAA